MNENDARPFGNLSLEEMDFDKIRKQYHFEISHQEQLHEVYEDLKKTMTPIANLRFIDKEAKNRLSFVKENEYIIGAITLGIGVDELLNNYYHTNHLFEAYVADCLCMALLSKSYEQFEALVYAECGQWPEKYEFIGDNYPIESISEILKCISKTTITHNEAYALIPSKSVVFLITSFNEKKRCALQICNNCSNISCTNKRKAFSYGEMQIFGRGSRV